MSVIQSKEAGIKRAWEDNYRAKLELNWLSLSQLNEFRSVILIEIIARDGKGVWYHKGEPRRYAYTLPTKHIKLLKETYNAIQNTQGVCRRSTGYGGLLQFIKENSEQVADVRE